MCGIAGFATGHAPLQPDAAGVLDAMCSAIVHRGPDDQGTLIAPGVALGMRRLSIIDLTGGRQPISGEDGHVSVVFNGEIYNYRELQRELETAGHRFRTHSDTEAIVHAYEQYGPSCLDRLRGMFALAIWDARTRTLFLARDRVGKKPLYYTLTPAGTFIFASELKALLRYPEIKPEVSLAALDAYLTFGYVPDPLSILRDVHKLAPGHALTFVNGRISVERYWDFPTMSETGGLSEPEAIDALRVALDDAVRQRLVADVPLGAFLSGGVDSSAVVGLMARHLNRPVKTFSIGFAEDSHDELRYARLAAKHFGTEHHEFIVTPEICHVVDELAWFLDEPFADASAIPTFMVSKLARAHVTVALSGDGGDELFGGYTRYLVDQQRAWAERLPQSCSTWHPCPGQSFSSPRGMGTQLPPQRVARSARPISGQRVRVHRPQSPAALFGQPGRVSSTRSERRGLPDSREPRACERSRRQVAVSR